MAKLNALNKSKKKSLEKINPTQKLSLCMIVKNEEKYLEDALISVQGIVDEIIIVDTGSTDKTVEIARKYGANVHFKAWEDDFSAARNESLKYATGQWVLVMDADERIPEGFKDNLKALLVDTESFLSYAIFIKSVVNAKTVQDSFGHHVVRLFKKTPEVCFIGAIHEQVSPANGRVMIPKESFYLEHLGYSESAHVEKKQMGRNRPIIEQQIEKYKGVNEGAYSFYSFYMGTIVTTFSERLHWFMEAIEKGPSPEYANHVQIAICQVLIVHYKQRKLEEGLAFANAQMEASPFLKDYKDFMELVGMLHLAHKDYQEAINAFERVLQIKKEASSVFLATDGDKIGSWGTCLNLVLAYQQQGDIAQAEYYGKQAIALYPAEDKEPILERIGMILGENAVADNYFAEEDFNEKNHTAIQVKNLSNHYLRQNQPYNALLLQSQMYPFEKIEENAGQLALNYIDQQDYPSAEQVFEAMQVISPENRLSKVGKDYVQSLKNRQAPEKDVLVQELEALLSVPELKLMLHMSMVYAFEGVTETVLERLEAQGEHYYAALRRALLEQQKGEIRSAIRRLEALIKEDESRLEAHIQLGNILLGEGDFVSAEKLFNIACQLNGTDWYAYYGYALSLAGQDQLAQAKYALSYAAHLSSGHPMVVDLMNLILAQEAQPAEHTTIQ